MIRASHLYSYSCVYTKGRPSLIKMKREKKAQQVKSRKKKKKAMIIAKCKATISEIKAKETIETKANKQKTCS